MTLIATVSEGDCCASISDTLMSALDIRGSADVFLPLKSKSGSFEIGSLALQRMYRKTFQFDNCNIMYWSGSPLKARAVIKRLGIVIRTRGKIDLDDLLRCELGGDCSDLSVIHASIVGGQLSLRSFGCFHKQSANSTNIVAGTGEFAFRETGTAYADISPQNENIEITNENDRVRNIFHLKNIQKIAVFMTAELTSDEHYLSAFGGWYEYSVIGKSGIAFIPIMVQFWLVNGQKIRMGTNISSVYQGSNLIVARYYIDSMSRKVVLNAYHIQDIANYGRAPSTNLHSYRTEYLATIHIILNENSGVRSFVVGIGPNNAFVDHSGGGVLSIKHSDKVLATVRRRAMSDLNT